MRPHIDMPGIVNVREFAPSDTEAVLSIYAASKLDELAHEAVVPGLIPLEQDVARYAMFKQSRVFVAVSHGIVGYVAVHQSQITGLFVHPQARHAGVGGVLLSHALKHVSGPATLSLAASNAPAVRLYERNGFAICGSFVAEYNGVCVNALMMRRA